MGSMRGRWSEAGRQKAGDGRSGVKVTRPRRVDTTRKRARLDQTPSGGVIAELIALS